MESVNEQVWYETDDYEAHDSVFAHVEAVENEQSSVHEANLCHARLYSNREEPGFDGRSNPYRHGWLGKVTENVIQSVVDTATSLIGKSRPKVSYMTDMADWDMQKLARQLERYTLGQFQALNIYDFMPLIFRDACVWGTGVLKMLIHEGEIRAERCLIDDIIVDEAEVPAGGMPRQVHQIRLVNREVLKARFPDKEDEIQESCEQRRDFAVWRQVDPDMVLVIESWYLKAGKGKQGRHTMCVDKATLVDEEYDEDYVPFVFYRWSPPLTGFYGQGLAEALMGFQIRINQLNDFIKKCQDLIAVPRVFVEASSKVMKVQLDNTIGAVIPYAGTRPPTFMTPQAVGAEIYQYKEQLKSAAFEFAGISKMAAQATRPEGIEAAVALRELSDNQSQRFLIQQQRYEQAYIDAAKLLLNLSRTLAASGTKPKVWMSDRIVREIDWPSANLDMNRFVLRAMPSSILGDTPAGRIQKVIELAQYGVQLDQNELRRLLDNPDIARADELAIAKEDDLEWTIEELSEGRWHQPEVFQDLARGIEKITAAYLIAKRTTKGDMKERDTAMNMYRQWIQYADRTLNPPELAMPPGAGVGTVPEGNMAETGLPGIVDPRLGDTGETFLPGLEQSLGV